MSGSQMTNYNERLDEILSYEYDVEGCQALHSGSRCLHCNEDPCPHCKRWGGRQRTEVRSMVDNKTKQAILDWHNKQVEELLDRLKEPTLEDIRLMQPDTSAEEQRRDVHMKMLRMSTNAKDAGHLTVVLLGFAVDVALEVAKQRELALLERMEDLNFEFMEPCEPDCSDVRHARHEGSWEHYWRMKAAIQEEKEKL